jgi:iron complex transport system ATP-binding protein
VSRALVSLHDLEVGYRMAKRPPRVVVGPLSLSLHPGELVCLLGPNGAGKSTLMRTMAGMQPSIRGEVRLDGQNLHRLAPRDLARRLSVVLTERVSAGLLSVYELVALGRHPFTDWTGRLTAHDHTIVQRSICAVGAETLAGRQVAELSDGERQKAMVARALAQEPEIMILDEITAFLDLPRRVEIMKILKGLAHDGGRAILLSTHDLDLALHTSDTLWVVQGPNVVAGMPEELVLNGVLEAAFASDGVWFDRERGAFRLRHQGRGAAAVDGDTVVATWTRRALERRGYDVVAGEDAPLRVRVGGTIADPLWTLVQDGRESEHQTLRSTLDAL